MAAHLLREVVRPLVADASRLTLARDHTTERHGRMVQRAGAHHNPTPGPASEPFVYGHVWVALGLLARHSTWGPLPPPLLARLHVRRRDRPGIPGEGRPTFRTKLK